MTSRDCAVEGGGGRWRAVKENARHRTAVVLHRLPPLCTALDRRLISPPRLHLYDHPVVAHGRALLVEHRVLELQLQVVAREEVLRRTGVARDPVCSRTVVRVELLHAADELEPLGHDAISA